MKRCIDCRWYSLPAMSARCSHCKWIFPGNSGDYFELPHSQPIKPPPPLGGHTVPPSKAKQQEAQDAADYLRHMLEHIDNIDKPEPKEIDHINPMIVIEAKLK